MFEASCIQEIFFGCPMFDGKISGIRIELFHCFSEYAKPRVASNARVTTQQYHGNIVVWTLAMCVEFDPQLKAELSHTNKYGAGLFYLSRNSGQGCNLSASTRMYIKLSVHMCLGSVVAKYVFCSERYAYKVFWSE